MVELNSEYILPSGSGAPLITTHGYLGPGTKNLRDEAMTSCIEKPMQRGTPPVERSISSGRNNGTRPMTSPQRGNWPAVRGRSPADIPAMIKYQRGVLHYCTSID